VARADQRGAGLRSRAIAADRVAPTDPLLFAARLDAAVCGVFLMLVAVILIDCVGVWAGILRGTRASHVVESPFVLSHLAEEA